MKNAKKGSFVMKKIAPMILVVLLLTACSSGFDGKWVLSSGQEESGCIDRLHFLERSNMEVQESKEKGGIVASYEKVGPDQYKVDMQFSSILLEMKRADEKLVVKTSDKMCMYDEVHATDRK